MDTAPSMNNNGDGPRAEKRPRLRSILVLIPGTAAWAWRLARSTVTGGNGGHNGNGHNGNGNGHRLSYVLAGAVLILSTTLTGIITGSIRDLVESQNAGNQQMARTNELLTRVVEELRAQRDQNVLTAKESEAAHMMLLQEMKRRHNIADK